MTFKITDLKNHPLYDKKLINLIASYKHPIMDYALKCQELLSSEPINSGSILVRRYKPEDEKISASDDDLYFTLENKIQADAHHLECIDMHTFAVKKNNINYVIVVRCASLKDDTINWYYSMKSCFDFKPFYERIVTDDIEVIPGSFTHNLMYYRRA